MRARTLALLSATAITLTTTLTLTLSAVAADAAPASPQRVQAVTAVAGPAVVLINQPVNTLCSGHKFRVGVWYQSFSGGSRAYRIAIWGPRHIRFFYRHGLASAKRWRFWMVKAGRRGRYRIVYSGHRPGSAKWTRFQIIIHASHCG